LDTSVFDENRSDRRCRIYRVGGGRLFVAEFGARACLTIDKLTYAANSPRCERSRTTGYRFEHADITDRARVDELLRSFRPDAVLHLAAESHVDRSIDGPGAFIKTNVEGTYVLLDGRDYCAVCRRSGRAIFGSPRLDGRGVRSLGPDGKFTEESRYLRFALCRSKAASDIWCGRGTRPTAADVMSNCSNNTAYHFPEKLIPLALLKALHASRSVYGKGDNVRDWAPCRRPRRALHAVLTAADPARATHRRRRRATNLQVVTAICALLDELVPGSPHGRTSC